MPKDKNAVKECRLLIGGEWVSGAETFPVKDKFTGETVAQAHKPSRRRRGCGCLGQWSGLPGSLKGTSKNPCSEP